MISFLSNPIKYNPAYIIDENLIILHVLKFNNGYINSLSLNFSLNLSNLIQSVSYYNNFSFSLNSANFSEWLSTYYSSSNVQFSNISLYGAPKFA